MLLLIAKYYHGRHFRESQEFQNVQNLVPPLTDAGIRVRCLHWDLVDGQDEFETALLRALRGEDRLWISAEASECLSASLLRRIRRLGIPIVALFWDAMELLARKKRYKIYQRHYWYKASLHRQHRLARAADAIVNFDWHASNHPEKTLFFPTLQPSQIFFPGAENRKTIDVSIVGHPEKGNRRAYIDSWPGIERGVRAHNRWLRLEEYADLIRTSKLSLNVPEFRQGADQLNGRAFEILWSRSALIQPVGPNICKFLEPEKEFIPLEGPNDLPHKVRYYLEHDDEREEIATNGWRRATTEYTARRLWAKVESLLKQRGVVNTAR